MHTANLLCSNRGHLVNDNICWLLNAQVYGAVTMNNTLCLGLFLLVRFSRFFVILFVLRSELPWAAGPSHRHRHRKRLPAV